VVTADRDERFAEAVRRKLLLEIAGTPDPRSRYFRLADQKERQPPVLRRWPIAQEPAGAHPDFD
jgi:hypothetical protein